MTEIRSFADLLEVARQQPEPQRLLFVFTRTVLPEDHDEAQAERFSEGQGGALMPVMYVDKTPEEIESFQALAEESRHMGEDWHVVLVAALPGRNGQRPSSEDAEEALKLMIRTVHAGGDLSGYLAFDRNGDPLQFLGPG